MNMYSCEPCLKFFNGVRPYESHLASENHKKKVNGPSSIVQNFRNQGPSSNVQNFRNQGPSSIVQDLRNCNFNSSSWEQDPFIIFLEKDYKCTLCIISLNSVDQVRCHVNGAKHRKAKASYGFFTNSNGSSSPNQNIDNVDGNMSSAALTGDSRFWFPMHTDEMQELVEDIKVFKPDDEIVFSSV